MVARSTTSVFITSCTCIQILGEIHAGRCSVRNAPRQSEAAPQAAAASASGLSSACFRGSPRLPKAATRLPRPWTPGTPRKPSRRTRTRRTSGPFLVVRHASRDVLRRSVGPKPVCPRCIIGPSPLPTHRRPLCAGPPRAATGLRGASLLRRLPSPVGTPTPSFASTQAHRAARSPFPSRPSPDSALPRLAPAAAGAPARRSHHRPAQHPKLTSSSP
jgi:hypothetical protein